MRVPTDWDWSFSDVANNSGNIPNITNKTLRHIYKFHCANVTEKLNVTLIAVQQVLREEGSRNGRSSEGGFVSHEISPSLTLLNLNIVKLNVFIDYSEVGLAGKWGLDEDTGETPNRGSFFMGISWLVP